MRHREFNKICKNISDFCFLMSICNDITPKTASKLVKAGIIIRKLGIVAKNKWKRTNKKDLKKAEEAYNKIKKITEVKK